MKKIKITEKQAKLLETLNSKKVLKVTKEQYNRIIESELNRPSLTETPELHEEEINEDLFREFVNELYGLNEEGAECKYDKLNKVMEAAGLIEGGKLVKEKFGKDARKVKEVVGKGLMKLKECGSEYQAVEMMEEAINRVEPEVGSPAYNSRRDTINQFGYDPDKGKYGDDIKNLVNDIETIYKNNEEESHSIIKNFLKIKSASKVSNLRQHDLKDLLEILEDKFVNPNQGSMELDEREHLGGKRAVGLDILNVAPFSELPETSADATKDTLELKIPNLDGNGSVYVKYKDYFRPHVVKQIPPYTHRPDIKQSGYVAEFKRMFGAEPVFTNIGEPYSHEGDRILGAKIDLNLAPKFRKRIELYDKSIKSDRDYYRSKGKQPYLEETNLGNVGAIGFEGPMNQKPTYESNVSTELEEADNLKAVNLKDVVINIPDESKLKLIKNTSALNKYFSSEQLKGLKVGDNKMKVNHRVYGNIMPSPHREIFSVRDNDLNESKLTSKIYEALKKK